MYCLIKGYLKFKEDFMGNFFYQQGNLQIVEAEKKSNTNRVQLKAKR